MRHLHIAHRCAFERQRDNMMRYHEEIKSKGGDGAHQLALNFTSAARTQYNWFTGGARRRREEQTQTTVALHHLHLFLRSTFSVCVFSLSGCPNWRRWHWPIYIFGIWYLSQSILLSTFVQQISVRLSNIITTANIPQYHWSLTRTYHNWWQCWWRNDNPMPIHCIASHT